MKPRWFRPFPITQVNYQRNNYPLDLRINCHTRYIYNTCHIGILKPYHNHYQQVLPHRHHAEAGPVKADRYKVKRPVNFRFNHPARDPIYHIRWKGHLLSDDQWIHADEIDE